ncbi:MAG: CoA pyrophosphatase [Halobacteriales archaeon]
MDLDRVAAHEPTTVESDDHSQAAVLVPVLERPDGAYLLFTKRADHLGEHPGQMSFPGGGREPSDESLWGTALREAEEEIGLLADEVTRVGRLDAIETVTDYAVTPFVGRVPDRPYQPDDREVAEISVLPVADFLDLVNYESERRDHPRYGQLRVHFFHVGGFTVWGATARIVIQLLQLTTDWEPPATVDRVVDRDPNR